jgi:hypothetical protein
MGFLVNWGNGDTDTLEGSNYTVNSENYAGRFYFNINVTFTNEYGYRSARDYSIRHFQGTSSTSPANWLRYPYLGYEIRPNGTTYQQVWILAHNSIDSSGSVASLRRRDGFVIAGALARNIVVNSVVIQQVTAPTIGYRVTTDIEGQASERIGKGYPTVTEINENCPQWVCDTLDNLINLVGNF